MKITRENLTVKNLSLTILVIAVLILGSVISYSKFFSSNDKVLAKISGDKITESDLIKKIKILTNGNEVDLSKIDDNIKQSLVKEIAAEKLLIKEARKSDVADKAEVKEQIQMATDEIQKIAFISDLYKNKITEENLKKRYDELAKDLEGKTEYKISHILVESKEKAESLRAIITNNKNVFAKIAAAESKDPSGAKNGGSLGYVVNGQLDSDFEKGFVNLQRGVVSAPVKTKFGWHLILVEDKRLAKVAEFEDAKDVIRKDLANKILKEYIENLLKEKKFKAI